MSSRGGKWRDILTRAAEIVNSYDTGVTLRQLFYRLVSEGVLENTQSKYTMLSKYTAEARREGWFPELLDRTRIIHRPPAWENPEEARAALRAQYRLDRTRGQRFRVFIGVEKNGLVEQLRSWFDVYGFPILALGGYSSQSYIDEIQADINRDGRPAFLFYGGDFDPSGEDIQRDFMKRTSVFNRVERIALTAAQVEEYNLPPMPGKSTDSRSRGFIERYGVLIQVEIDALPPDSLRELFEEAVLNETF